MTEIWKDIEGLEGLYQVSTKGRVRSLRGKNIKILKQSSTTSGYLFIRLFYKTYYVHRLVANAFIPNPNNLSDVDHIDNNKKNNNISNLQWLSHRDNIIKYHESIRPDDYIPIEERTYKNYYNKYYKRKYYYYNDIRFKTYSELASYLNLTVGQIRLFCKKHNIKRRA